ncbi:MAG: hypothetical protein QXR87_05460 [Candidatus Hadarchaeales archaeon]
MTETLQNDETESKKKKYARFEVKLWDSFSPQELVRILKAEESPVLRVLYLTLFLTGLRIHEVLPGIEGFGLRWEQIDVDSSPTHIIIHKVRTLKKFHRIPRYSCPTCKREWRLANINVCPICGSPLEEVKREPCRREVYRDVVIRKDNPFARIWLKWYESVRGKDLLKLFPTVPSFSHRKGLREKVQLPGIRADKELVKRGYIFPFNYETVRYRLKKAAKKAGVYRIKNGKKVYPSPHWFRSQRAHQLVEEVGADWQDLMDWFGWSNPEYARLYAGTSSAKSLMRRGLG